MLTNQDTYTIKQVAYLQNIPESAVRLAIQREELKAIRFNARLIRISRNDLVAWVDYCKCQAKYTVRRRKTTRPNVANAC